jgi:hypothetical protein
MVRKIREQDFCALYTTLTLAIQGIEVDREKVGLDHLHAPIYGAGIDRSPKKI